MCPEPTMLMLPAGCALRQVIAGVGWATHALVFEYWDGSRCGTLLNVHNQEQGLFDEHSWHENVVTHGGRWLDVEPGEEIVRIEVRVRVCVCLCACVCAFVHGCV